MHDFEAANSDELELRRGDVVLVVPTASVEDQVRTAGDIYVVYYMSIYELLVSVITSH